MDQNTTYRQQEWFEKLDPQFNTLSFHLQHPEIDPDIYIRSQHVAIGDQVLKKRRIYLDQKYWIYCRDVIRGKPQHPLHPEIYKLLSNAVKSGVAVCPASHLILREPIGSSLSSCNVPSSVFWKTKMQRERLDPNESANESAKPKYASC